eukprot:gene19070-biopygen23708
MDGWMDGWMDDGVCGAGGGCGRAASPKRELGDHSLARLVVTGPGIATPARAAYYAREAGVGIETRRHAGAGWVLCACTFAPWPCILVICLGTVIPCS